MKIFQSSYQLCGPPLDLAPTIPCPSFFGKCSFPMSPPCHPFRAHQCDVPPPLSSAPQFSTRRKQTRRSQLCLRLKIFTHLFFPRQVCSSQAGLLPQGCACTPGTRCSLYAAERWGVVMILLNHPKRALSYVSDAKCALEFNCCYSA